MKKILAALLLACTFCASAFAEGSPLYGGVMLGSSSIGSYSSTAIGGFLGYKLQDIRLGSTGTLAVEGQYTSLGSIPYSNNFSSFGVDAVAMIPLQGVPNLSVFGKLGLNNITGNFHCNGLCSYSDSSGLVVDAGIGAQYKFTRDVSGRVGYQYYDSNFSALYVAAVFNF
jgi:hypothetical protein